MPAPATRPAWDVVRLAALEPANLPRVLAGLGFDRCVEQLVRGDLAWWLPDYAPANMLTLLHAGREAIAQGNRDRRDSPVLMMLRRHPAPVAQRSPDTGRWHLQADTVVWIDVGAGLGCWRTLSGAQRGDCLISLAMLMWDEPRFGRAALRLARLCGLPRIPDQPAAPPVWEWIEAALQRRVAA